ncbi:ribosome rescue protein RqcH [Desulfurococcus mucosus]|uniref:ribosome rescue protein RqcH n=1 Tax=Desulfurococcus mucosus TaxID=2275 RepID=UPI00200F545F|nr:ribosome rescue protein RqcH [Desulfurococcus mucosus]
MHLLKKAMDILDVYAWVGRHGASLTSCFVDNAYHCKSYWILKLRCPSGVTHLKIEPAVRIHLSQSIPEEKDIDGFTRFLRSRVRDSRILSVRQPWWERIVVLETGAREKPLRHYIEVVPRGQWVVADPSDRIIYSTRFTEYRDRVIKPSETYKPPPFKGSDPWDSATLRDRLKEGRDLVRALVTAWGLPGHIAEEILYRAGLLEAKNKRVSEIPSPDVERLIEEYGSIVREASTGMGYLVYSGENTLDIYTSYNPLLFRDVYNNSVKQVEDINTAIDAYFTEYEAELERQRRLDELAAAVKEIEARIKRQEEVIRGYREEVEKIGRILQLIYGNYASVDEALECARSTRAAKGWEHIAKDCPGVVGVYKDKGIVVLRVNGEVLELSIRKGLDKQVVELEKKRGELVGKIESAVKVLEEMRRQLNEASSTMSIEDKTVRRLSPTLWYERFHWLFTRNGFLAIGGRDQSQNEMVVRKYLGDNDVFIHADIHGGSAVVLKSRGLHSVEDVVDASYLAACYSRAWRAGFSFIEVFWVPGSQVSKTPPSGEYLPRGAFMIYGSKNFLSIPLRLAVGARFFSDDIYGDYIKVIVGSEELVSRQAIAYAVLTPGDEDVRDVSESIREFLEKAVLEYKGARYRIGLAEVESRIPGPSRIIGLHRGAVSEASGQST